MKSFIRVCMFTAIILVSVLLPLNPPFADNRNYTIDRYLINAHILPDGSIDMEERITYRFSGNFNGIFRNIDYMGTDGIKDIRIASEKNGASSDFILNPSAALDADGSPGTYNIERNNEIANLKIFEKSFDESKTFIFKYTFVNAATRYNDTGEFNRRLVDANWDVPLNNIEINIRLPEGANRDEIRVFGHGPLTGKSEITDDRNVRFSIDYLSPGNMVETLVLFPARLILESARIVKEDALPRILENEKFLADKANAEREEARRQVEEYTRQQEEKQKLQALEEARRASVRPYGNILTFLIILVWFGSLYYIYVNYDREFKHGFEGKYYRELPGEYTPAEMSVLVSMGSVDKRDITATLMDLVRKSHLVLSKDTYIKRVFFKNKEIEDYSLSLNPQRDLTGLKKHESFLINWFVGKIGNDRKVFLDEITAYAKTSSGGRRFLEDYKKWCDLVKDEAAENNFFDESARKGRTMGILISMGFSFTGFLIAGLLYATFGIILIPLAFVMFIFSVRIKRRSLYGSKQNAMWLAFKRFLQDFSRLDKATLPSIVMWEHYLVYAISLGVAKEVIKQLPLVFTDSDLMNPRLTYMYGYNLRNMSAFTGALDSTMDSVNSSINKAMAVARSANSSPTGHGGGFSGGTSGGGGGRGGGGAF